MCKSDDAVRGSILNVGSAIGLFLVLTTYGLVSQLPYAVTPLTFSIIFFNNLNTFIAMCEICLGLNIDYIQKDYQKLLKRYRGNEWGACVAYLTTPLTVRQLFDSKVWSRMWSTYALYDPSYQNRESFGFFIDFGNGLSTIPPTMLVNAAMIRPDMVSPLWAGCVGLAMYWQVMYGAIVYVFTFVFNRRHEGKSLLEVGLFVGFSNSLWIAFPPLGMYACFCMLRDGDMDVFA